MITPLLYSATAWGYIQKLAWMQHEPRTANIEQYQ